MERHEKWVPVEAGTLIPAGQPYRVEWLDWTERKPSTVGLAIEEPGESTEWTTTEWYRGFHYSGLFVDTSWRPPLVLPTEPTWGIVKHRHLWWTVGAWWLRTPDQLCRTDGVHRWKVEDVLDFIKFTPDQVQRIQDGL